MNRLESNLDSPTKIALIYLIVGITWIVVTDVLVHFIITDPRLATQIQLIKGWVFVALSAILIYFLIAIGYRERSETGDRLDSALQQTSILHRILRHNLRNTMNIIHGNVELLETEVPEQSNDSIAEIKDEINKLIQISEKTEYLREVVLGNSTYQESIDLVEVVESVIDQSKDRYPRTQFSLRKPETLTLHSDTRIKRAIQELIDNAIVHNDRLNPSVRIELQRQQDAVEISISDNGPGMPDIERDVLQRGIETPMLHSEGLGLWISRTIIAHNNGTFDISDNEPRGTNIRIRLPLNLPPN